MIIHLIGDAAGCIVVLITGFIIKYTVWKWKVYADAIGRYVFFCCFCTPSV